MMQALRVDRDRLPPNRLGTSRISGAQIQIGSMRIEIEPVWLETDRLARRDCGFRRFSAAAPCVAQVEMEYSGVRGEFYRPPDRDLCAGEIARIHLDMAELGVAVGIGRLELYGPLSHRDCFAMPTHDS